MPAALPPVHLLQIAWSDATAAAIQPGFALLDNRANPRPDWYEYVPIRDYLQQQTLDEDAFYGFFSPKFTAKTGWQAHDVRAFVHRHHERADVLPFSAHPNQVAFFVNVFEQGEFFHPGLMQAATDWLATLGWTLPLASVQMDARQMVFCNYFVARPRFWRAWLALGESLHALCEGPPSPLRDRLTAPTDYPGGTQLKIFLMERMASLLLAVDRRWRSVPADPYVQGRWPHESLRRDPTDAIVSDALKHASLETGWTEYAAAFQHVRERVTGRKAA